MSIIDRKLGKCQKAYRIWQNICGKNFHDFHGFSLNHEYFPVNHGLADRQYKFTNVTVKVLP